MKVGHGWDSSVFAGVENEGFEIYDFVFELNFLGFLCVFVSQENLWGCTKEHEHVLKKK